MYYQLLSCMICICQSSPSKTCFGRLPASEKSHLRVPLHCSSRTSTDWATLATQVAEPLHVSMFFICFICFISIRIYVWVSVCVIVSCYFRYFPYQQHCSGCVTCQWMLAPLPLRCWLCSIFLPWPRPSITIELGSVPKLDLFETYCIFI